MSGETIERGIAAMVIEGVAFHQERTVTEFHDVHQTPWGPVDFGYVRLGPWRTMRTVSEPLAFPPSEGIG